MLNKYTVHAEQQCIKKCNNKRILKNCILVLVRLNRMNNVAIPCAPCTMCCGIIKKYGIQKVINLID